MLIFTRITFELLNLKLLLSLFYHDVLKCSVYKQQFYGYEVLCAFRGLRLFNSHKTKKINIKSVSFSHW